jgi:O-antigen ligase
MVRAIKKYVFVASFFLCATVLSRFTQDQSLTIRHVIWAAVTLALFFLCKNEIPLSRILLCFVGYFVFAGLSLFWTTNPIKGLYEVTKIALMLISFCCACEILREDKDFFIKGMSLLGLILGAYGLFEITTTGYARGCLGTMGIRNVWASAQFLTLPFCVSSIKKWPVIGIGSSVLIVLNLIMLSNRTSVLALIVSLLILLFYYKKWRYAAAIGLIVTAGFILNPMLLNTGSLQARYAVWTGTSILIRENPFFGLGVNSWGLEMPRYASLLLEPHAFIDFVYQRVHNDFLWVMSEIGIFGFICYAGIFIYGLYYAVKSRNIRAITLLAGYAIIASFSFPKERAYHSMMLVAGLADAKTGCNFKKIRIPVYVKVAVMAVLCLAVTEFSLCHSSERHIRKMAIARDMKNWPEVLAESKKISPLRTMDGFTIPVKWYTAEAHYHLGNSEQAVADTFEAFRHSPNNLYVLDRMGQMFEGLGDEVAAEAFYTRALNSQPNFEFSQRKLNKLKGI